MTELRNLITDVPGLRVGNAGDDCLAFLRVQFAGRKIVEEKQRFSALHDQVIDTHGDKVDPYRVQPAAFNGDPQLSADAVIGGDKDRILEAGCLEIEQAAKAADLAVGSGTPGGADRWLDGFDQCVSGIDVDASLLVRQAV